MADDGQRIIEDFDEAVNMTPKELEEWPETEESESVGQSDGGGESEGHESGRRIAEIKRKNKSDYTDEDIQHMKRVSGYVKRHLGQGPKTRPRGLEVALLADELGSRPPEVGGRSTRDVPIEGRGRARKGR